MPTIGLTTFVDFISATGLPRVRVVEAARRGNNQPYDPRKDFYKRLRDASVSYSRGQICEADFLAFPETLSDQKKRSNFPAAVDSWINWQAKDGGGYFAPPRGEYSCGDLTVNINPEIGMTIGQTKVAIKSWFKTEAVPKARLNYILATLRFGLPDSYTGDVSILDVRRRTLHRAGKVNPSLKILLKGEAIGFMAMWDALGE
jgi:hypothetical protein